MLASRLVEVLCDVSKFGCEVLVLSVVVWAVTLDALSTHRSVTHKVSDDFIGKDSISV